MINMMLAHDEQLVSDSLRATLKGEKRDNWLQARPMHICCFGCRLPRRLQERLSSPGAKLLLSRDSPRLDKGVHARALAAAARTAKGMRPNKSHRKIRQVMRL